MGEPTKPHGGEDLLARFPVGGDAKSREQVQFAREKYLHVLDTQKVHWTFPWALLVWVRFDPSNQLSIRFSSHTLTVTGRNLQILFNRIMRHEVEMLEGKGERHDMGERQELAIHAVDVVQD